MKTLLVQILSVLFLTNSSNTILCIASDGKSNNTTVDNEKLKVVWHKFSTAILQGDTVTIRAMSATCINCTNCPGLTTSNQIVVFGTFMNGISSVIFDSTTLHRLLDTSKVAFVNNQHNQELYSDSCILTSTDLARPRFVEVVLTHLDHRGSFEGAQHAFAFIETQHGYKFCGYSSIP